MNPLSVGPQLLLYTSIMSNAYDRAIASCMSVVPTSLMSSRAAKELSNHQRQCMGRLRLSTRPCGARTVCAHSVIT